MKKRKKEAKEKEEEEKIFHLISKVFAINVYT